LATNLSPQSTTEDQFMKHRKKWTSWFQAKKKTISLLSFFSIIHTFLRFFWHFAFIFFN
jgi:hypothetical protein